MLTGTGPFPEPLTVTGALAQKVVAELPSFAVDVLLQVGFREFAAALSPLLGEAELDIDQNWGAAGTVFRQAAIVSAKIARDLYKARDTKPSDVEKTLWWICHQVLQYGGQQPKPKPSAEKLEEYFNRAVNDDVDALMDAISEACAAEGVAPAERPLAANETPQRESRG